MPKLSPVVALDRILATLTERWQEHHAALAHIEVVFAKYGINPAKAAPAQPKAAAEAAAPSGRKRRKRRKFGQTAEEFVLSVLAGGKSLPTKQINNVWHSSGRGASADNTLTKMVKERKLKRRPVKDGRGSEYAVA